MKVRRIEVVRAGGVQRGPVAVRREIVDQADGKHVAGPAAQRGTGDRPLVRSHVELVATDFLVGIPSPERRAQPAVDRTANLGLDQQPRSARWRRGGAAGHGGGLWDVLMRRGGTGAPPEREQRRPKAAARRQKAAPGKSGIETLSQ